MREDFRVIERLEIDEDQENREQEPGISDPVDDERLRSGLGRRDLVIVVADQQIRAQADAFPSDEEHGVVVAHDQEQHRNHEQVHVREEARESIFSVHVPDRIHVDEESHSRHHKQHHAGQRIDKKAMLMVRLPPKIHW